MTATELASELIKINEENGSQVSEVISSAPVVFAASEVSPVFPSPLLFSQADRFEFMAHLALVSPSPSSDHFSTFVWSADRRHPDVPDPVAFALKSRYDPAILEAPNQIFFVFSSRPVVAFSPEMCTHLQSIVPFVVDWNVLVDTFGLPVAPVAFVVFSSFFPL
jgi:hypothetical protein